MQNDQPEKARAQSSRNTAEKGDDRRMMRWGSVEDPPQAEGYETPEAERPKQGTKTPKNNQKKKESRRKQKKKKNQRKW
jgi:hypothetical protein